MPSVPGQPTWPWSQQRLVGHGFWNSHVDLAMTTFHRLQTYSFACMKLVAVRQSIPKYKYIQPCSALVDAVDGILMECLLILYIYGYVVWAFPLSAQVTRVTWKMWHYGSTTPKPHFGYGNSPMITLLDKGPLKEWKRKSLEQGRPLPKSCEQYTNSKGAKCYKGTKFLKKTETLDKRGNWMFARFLYIYIYMNISVWNI